jgi:hypothetical protein
MDPTRPGPRRRARLGSLLALIVALVLGWLMASGRGRALMNRWRSHHPSRREKKKKKGPSWAERRLDQANVAVAFAIGAAINLPGRSPCWRSAISRPADTAAPRSWASSSCSTRSCSC